MEGRNLYEARRRMGMELADEHPVETDLVMPVPDTGAPAAAGYAEASGIPYREGLVRNRYTGRTFIQPSQTMRQRGVTMKLNPLREVVRGRRLTVVDDSIVRGTTTKQIVALLRRAGAAEVHVRISAPPIYHPCFYGIDTQIETELIAGDEVGRGDPRLHRRRFARLPLDRRRPGRARPAVRPVLLRLLRRPLPGAGPVRRREPQVRPRGGAGRRDRDALILPTVGARSRWLTCAGRTPGPASTSPPASGRSSSCAPRSSRPGAPRCSAGSAASPARSACRPAMREPVLVSATDGVGTKTAIASAVGRYDTIGIDLVAMCADDVVCSGAAPLFFLDYVAVGRLDPIAVAELVGGVAAGCRDAGCALVGGETAEHPGLMEADEFDLAGFCVGVVERDRILDGPRRPGGRRDRRAGGVRAPRQRLLARPVAGRPATTSTCASPTRHGSG